MNKFILIAMDKERYTKEELKKYADKAYSIYCAATTHKDIAASSLDAAAYASSSAAYAYASVDYRLEECLDAYFDITGENKQTYIDAIAESK